MKIIDEKGKLFGKVNIIDLVLGLIILCVVCGVGYKLFFDKNSGEEIPEEKGTVYITVRATELVPEAEDYIQEGQKIVMSDELTNIEIVSVDFKDSQMAGITSSGKLVLASNPQYKDAEITLKAEATEDGVGIFVNGKSVKINQNFDITTREFSTEATVIGLEFQENE